MRRRLLIALGLVCLVLITYSAAGHCDFVEYDDPSYVTENARVQQGLSLGNVSWALTARELGAWYPLVWISHMACCQFFAVNPAGHHWVNLALHAMGVLALYAMLLQLTGALWRSAMVAALFAVHPLHVESVAWVGERKDVLFAPFYFFTIIAYARWTRSPRPWRYAIVLASFILCLAGKPMGITLPAVLLLIDTWPLHRLKSAGDFPRLLREKIPLFAIACIDLLITIRAQQALGVVRRSGVSTLSQRVGNALLSYLSYLEKTLVPMRLSAFYPMRPTIPFIAALLALATLLIISGLLYRQRQRSPWLWMGWLWFIITLVPVIGFLQVGAQSMADRYMYVPAVGLYVLIVWGAGELVRSSKGRVLAGIVGACVLIALMIVGRHQVSYWQDSDRLFTHAIEVTDDNWLAYYCRGTYFGRHGDYGRAIADLSESVRINPGYGDAYNNLGNCVYMTNPAGAIAYYQQAVEQAPTDVKGYLNLANALYATGQKGTALPVYQQVLQMDPSNIAAQRQIRLIHFETK